MLLKPGIGNIWGSLPHSCSLFTGFTLGVGRTFSRGAYSVFFQGWSKLVFTGGGTVVNFHFTNSKLREKQFSAKKLTGKCKVSKTREGFAPSLPPRSDAHD